MLESFATDHMWRYIALFHINRLQRNGGDVNYFFYLIKNLLYQLTCRLSDLVFL
jgi:hypothetical protein